MSTAPRPDHRSSEYRGAERIALARANRPRVDNNGKPLPDQPRRAFHYDSAGLLESVTDQPDDDGQQ